MDQNQAGSFTNTHLVSIAAVILGSVLSFVIGIINFRRDKKLKRLEKEEAQREEEKREFAKERREEWRDYKRDVALKLKELDDLTENIRLSQSAFEVQVANLWAQIAQVRADVETLFNEKNAVNKRMDQLEPIFKDLYEQHKRVMQSGGHRNESST